MGWPKCYVKIRLTWHFSHCILINVSALLKQLLLFNKTFSLVCHVGHPESGHSVCHRSENDSKLGLKLSATIYAHRPICCSACFDDYDHMMVYWKTLSTSFHVIIDYTFYEVFLCRIILLLVWWLFLVCHQLAQVTQNAGALLTHTERGFLCSQVNRPLSALFMNRTKEIRGDGRKWLLKRKATYHRQPSVTWGLAYSCPHLHFSVRSGDEVCLLPPAGPLQH